LIDQGWNVSVSVVTSQASLKYLEMPLEHLWIGPLQGPSAISKVLHNDQCDFDWVVDATHPFAQLITRDLAMVCMKYGKSLIRFERPKISIPEANFIRSPIELSNQSLEGRRILLAIGARHLPETVTAVKKSRACVFARVLPTAESLGKAFASQLPSDQIAALEPNQGEAFGSIERGLCRRWSITDLLFRQSGGLTEKLWKTICKKENIKPWVIIRPDSPQGIEIVNTPIALQKRLLT